MTENKETVLLVVRIPEVISGVINAINEGVEQAKNFIEYAAPPEKVVFTGGAAVSLNSLKRTTITEILPKKRITTVGEVQARDEFYLNGALVETKDYVDSSAYTIEQITGAGGSERVTFENNAIGFVLEIPGPKSS